MRRFRGKHSLEPRFVKTNLPRPRRDWRACIDSDRTATCVVPPLGAGHYDVVDGEGRPLGAIEIPATQPIGDFEPTCTPIP